MNDSIFLIQSKQSNNSSMGTGFAIHQDKFGTYVLTCAHVIADVIEPKIDGSTVEVKALGSKETIDLAVLYVKGAFKTPFELQKEACKTKDVQLIGYSKFSGDKHQGKPRDATILGEKFVLKNGKNGTVCHAWEMIAKDNFEIERGNSGSPLICKESGKVIAVVSNHKGVQKGFALAIEHLKDIWQDMPPLLLEENNVSPFVGLSAFSIEESHLFFGRDKESKDIIERLKKQDLVTVVGDSGSGKSSVIKAGVIPKYLNGVLHEDKELKRVFHLIEMRPATNPFNDLANSLEHIDEMFHFNLEDMSHLKKVLKSKDAGDILNAFESLFRGNEVTLLLYIDQFEELFTLCEKDLETEFMTFLLYFLESQSSKLKIKIVFTMRRDYYNLIAEYERFFQQTQASKYTLRRMKNEQIKECIEKPLEKTSIAIEQIGIFSKAVLQDMGDESSELTLLQIALTQTWQHKQEYDNNLLRTYHEIGEVSGALAKLADDTWQILSIKEQKTLQYIFIRIIKSNETGGVTRRLAKKDEFSGEAWKLAQKLSSALDYEGEVANEKNAQLGRLLKIKGEKGKVLELTHEALIKQWPKYQVWLKKVSKDDLKRTHDYVIIQNQIYRKQKEKIKIKFLLSGYELERAEKLLDDEYIEYLSEDEVAYIERSKFYKNVIWGLIKGFLFIILVLLVGLYVVNNELNKSNKESRDYMITLMNSTAFMLDERKTKEEKHNRANKVFTKIAHDYKEDKIVVVAWYNYGKILEGVSFIKAEQWYTKLIDKFKNNNNIDIIRLVTKSKLNRALLVNSNNKINKILIRNFIQEFYQNSDKVISEQSLKAYINLLWFNLLDEDFESIKEYFKKIDKDTVAKDLSWTYQLNLAHYYLLTGDFDTAKNIYFTKKEKSQYWKKEIKEDIRVFQRECIHSEYFDEILELLK